MKRGCDKLLLKNIDKEGKRLIGSNKGKKEFFRAETPLREVLRKDRIFNIKFKNIGAQ